MRNKANSNVQHASPVQKGAQPVPVKPTTALKPAPAPVPMVQPVKSVLKEDNERESCEDYDVE